MLPDSWYSCPLCWTVFPSCICERSYIVKSSREEQYIKCICFPIVSSTVLYTYYVAIKCWKALVLGTGALLGLHMPSSIVIVSKVTHMSVTLKPGSLAWNSLWNPRFLYLLAYLTSAFGYLIGSWITWALKTEILSSSSLSVFFSLLVFPISVSGVTSVLGICLDFSPISFNLP